MSVERYPSNDTARRARSIRTLRPHGKPPGYQKDFTPRDKRGRPLKDREGIKKPKQIPKGLQKAAAQTATRLIGGRLRKMVEFAPEAIAGLNALDRWSDTWWQDLLPTAPVPSGSVVDLTFWDYYRCTGRPKEDFFSEDGGSCGRLSIAGTMPEATSTSQNLLYGHKYVGHIYGPSSPAYDQRVSAIIRKSGAPIPTPVFEPALNPQPLPVVTTGTELRFEFPQEFPIPNRWADAVAEPGSQPDGSPEPDKQPGRKDAQADTVTVPLIPGLAVVLLPVTEVVPVPDTQVITVPPSPDAPVTVVTRPPPETISRVPRGRRVKEPPKANITSVMPMTWAVVNAATETADFIGALHDSLPEKLQAKKKSGWSKPKLHEMAEAIYRHAEHVSVATAINNFVNEWIEDMWYGAAGQVGKKANQATGQATGADRALAQGGAGPGAAPEVHLDVHTGEWQVTTPWGNFSGNMSKRGIDYNT